ncbi:MULTISPECIES: phosphonate C-P lyase system protein PhnH [unclassified Chelatococcus]|jgi:alpha-D-ribose 1-methylphosphonate 5-triphosphate synthase subunit PhnH|uniref:phosphonate C-P lyase system protein PhnH n=1 Tax=unclassified Chelatococcus TaxID=2638111 RepID=UPI0020C07F9E|nr:MULTISPECIES: phosphonate C-P lyase system protein PhnH [unclassified Chelatococcus]MCO5079053.1 phosphonate C-P lyase system protein PhnH [Chelatococcus sp.]CAH1663315.1 Alpha-D-ribose 1-methylphosphonate 5-triphosphate synthase subunit PhnH [Hyphomicrobiales bacterium]CAH1682295.1 Alpha-D-ribose 1-methylphosphonate 5-triphosphate synthase subunit PhnH [Hyphomicrobiales bacterium]
MTLAFDTAGLEPGFSNPVFDSQSVFRNVLNAIAYPGAIEQLAQRPGAPEGVTPAMAAVALTLCDLDTPVWRDAALSSDAVATYLRFHCGVPVVAEPAEARFALIGDAVAMPRLSAFEAGDERYPDRSATLVITVPSLTEGPRRQWSGPGIPRRRAVSVAGLPDWFWADWALNQGLYPLGVDVLFACGDAVVGLPRGIAVKE